MPSGKLTRLMARTVREESGVPWLLKNAPVRASASAFSTIRVGGAGAAEDGEHAAGAVHHDDGEARAIGGEGRGIDQRLHFGGGELDGVGGGIDGQRGGVAIGDGNFDEAAAGGGGQRELHVGIVQRRGIGGRAGDQDLRGRR